MTPHAYRTISNYRTVSAGFQIKPSILSRLCQSPINQNIFRMTVAMAILDRMPMKMNRQSKSLLQCAVSITYSARLNAVPIEWANGVVSVCDVFFVFFAFFLFVFRA